MNVNIYIETSFKGPSTRRAAGAWLVEYISSTGRPVTRGGMLYADKTTENELALRLIRKAFSILTKTCCVTVFTGCGHVLRTMNNHWLAQWQKKGWFNAKGNPVKNAELWDQCAMLMGHHMTDWTDADHEYSRCMQDRIKKELDKEHGMPAAGYEEVEVSEWNTQTNAGRKEQKDYV